MSDDPTLKDVGSYMVQTSPCGLAAPKVTPKERVQLLHDAFKQAMDSPKFLEALKQFDMDIQYMDSEQYRAFAKDAIVTESAILEEMGAEKLQDRKSTRLNSSHVASSYAVV